MPVIHLAAFLLGARKQLPTSWTVFGTPTTSTAATITMPASIAAGDLIVICHSSYNPVNTTLPTVTPSGFTNAVTASNTNGTSSATNNIISYKLANGTEGSTSVSVVNNSQTGHKESSFCIVYKPNLNLVSSISEIDSQGTNTVGFTSSSGNVTVAASGQTAPNITVGFCFANTAVAPTDTGSLTTSGNKHTNASWAGGAFYEIIQNSSPANMTINSTVTSTGIIIVDVIACFTFS